MTETEYAEVCMEIATLWPASKWEVGTMRAGEALILDLDQHTAIAAVRVLAAEGERFSPNPGQVRRRAVELADPVPSVDEALAEVEIWKGRINSGRTPEWSHPAIGDAVAALGGIRYLGMSDNPTADRAHFIKVYGTCERRHATTALMPPSVAALLVGLDLSAQRALGAGE